MTEAVAMALADQRYLMLQFLVNAGFGLLCGIGCI